jgi:hypothetical protein
LCVPLFLWVVDFFDDEECEDLCPVFVLVFFVPAAVAGAARSMAHMTAPNIPAVRRIIRNIVPSL